MRTASSHSAAVGSGTRRPTRSAASSCRVPVGSPAASRSIRPRAGSGVVRSMPARCSARLLTQAPWPSRLTRYTGRSATMASSSAAVGVPPGKASIDHPPPEIHAREGWAAA
jgi:hypothetical protein